MNSIGQKIVSHLEAKNEKLTASTAKNRDKIELLSEEINKYSARQDAIKNNVQTSRSHIGVIGGRCLVNSPLPPAPAGSNLKTISKGRLKKLEKSSTKKYNSRVRKVGMNEFQKSFNTLIINGLRSIFSSPPSPPQV